MSGFWIYVFGYVMHFYTVWCTFGFELLSKCWQQLFNVI
jgi:hypothetical protein